MALGTVMGTSRTMASRDIDQLRHRTAKGDREALAVLCDYEAERGVHPQSTVIVSVPLVVGSLGEGNRSGSGCGDGFLDSYGDGYGDGHGDGDGFLHAQQQVAR